MVSKYLAWVLVGFVTLLSGFIYGLTASRFPQNYADSSELMTAAWVGGVAHPPGYPLYTVFLDWVMHLPWLGNPAWQGNLTSAFFQALSLSLLFLVTTEVLILMQKKRPFWLIHLAALGGTLTVAFANHFWSHALITEVFALNHLFVGLFLFCTLRWYRQPAFNRWFISSLIVLGLGASHHQTILFLVPGWIILLLSVYFQSTLSQFSIFNFQFSIKCLQLSSVSTLKSQVLFRILLSLLILVLSFTLPFTITFIQHANQASFSWHFEPSVKGLWDLWARNLYSQEGSAIETYTRQIDLRHSIISIGIYGQFLFEQYTWLGISLIIIGLIYGFKMSKKNRNFSPTYYFLLITYCISGPLLAAYLKFPLAATANDTSYFWGIALRLRMFLMHEYLLGIMLSLGILGLGAGWDVLLKKIAIGKWKLSNYSSNFYFPFSIFLIGFLVLPLYLFKVNFSIVNQAKSDFDSCFYRQILESVPENAILIGDSDHVFGLLYQQLVAHTRSDVIIVPSTLEMRWPYFHREQPDLLHFAYTKRTDQMLDLISWSLYKKRQLYLLDPDLELLEKLGVEANPFYAVPSGYLVYLARLPQKIQLSDYSLSQELLDKSAQDLWQHGLKGNIAFLHSVLGYYFAKTGEAKGANRHFEFANSLSQLETSRTDISLLKELSLASPNHYLSVNKPLATDYLQKFLETAANQNPETAIVYLQKALYLDPLNLEARRALAELYQQTNQQARAAIEQQNLSVTLQTIMKDQ